MYRTVTCQGEETKPKSFQFFLREKQKKYVGNVQDREGRVPTFEVTGAREEHTRRVRTSRARDMSLMSISPKSRRSMFTPHFAQAPFLPGLLLSDVRHPSRTHSDSTTVVSHPMRASQNASAGPAMPAPTMRTLGGGIVSLPWLVRAGVANGVKIDLVVYLPS